jgi:hypothetical protein
LPALLLQLVAGCYDVSFSLPQVELNVLDSQPDDAASRNIQALKAFDFLLNGEGIAVGAGVALHLKSLLLIVSHHFTPPEPILSGAV